MSYDSWKLASPYDENWSDAQQDAMEKAYEEDYAEWRGGVHTYCWAKPIPMRRFDWEAIYSPTYDPGDYDSETGNYHGGSPIGYGATEAEAVADLREKMGIE